MSFCIDNEKLRNNHDKTTIVHEIYKCWDFYPSIIFSEQLILWLAGNSNSRLSSSTSTGRSYLIIVKIMYSDIFLSKILILMTAGFLPSFQLLMLIVKFYLEKLESFKCLAGETQRTRVHFYVNFLWYFTSNFHSQNIKNKTKYMPQND